MSALAQEQRAFLQAVRSAHGGGLAIYRRSIEANHRAALQAAYPVVERLVGAAFFAEAARLHGLRSPSTSGDLHRYGSAFATFLASYSPAASLAYLPDVAALEWARHRAALAADVPPFDFGVVARLPQARWSEIRLQVHPSVALLASPHSCIALWEANQPGRDGAVANVDLAERVVVWRDPANVVHARPLDEEAWRLLQVCARGSTLAQALETWTDAGEPIGEWIARLVRDGVITACAWD